MILPADIPTALTPAEAHLLANLARDRRVVEAGSLLGYSTIVLASQARSVISIDQHEGYPHGAPRSTWRAFRENLRRYGVHHRVAAIRGDACEALPRAPAEVGFLDLTGAADLTREAIQAMRAPVIAVHDYARNGCHGSSGVIDWLVRRGAFRVEARADTTVVLRRAA